MASQDDNLTHEEIWDDSALINSWNDALEEYKKYHSIHAKGGSLKDLEALEAQKSKGNEEAEANKVKATITSPPHEELSHTATSTSEVPANAAPTAPIQLMLGSVKDESLKKLLMSWYYAGYYTGLYEGQQQTGQGIGE